MNLSLTIGVTDLEQSYAFYGDLIGLPVSWHNENRRAFLIVMCANCTLVLQPITAMETLHPALFQNFSRQQPGNGIQFELACGDLNSVELRLKKQGWSVLYELDDKEHGRREIWVQDPDGYLIVLNQE